MKRAWLILIGGLVLAVAGYAVFYCAGMAHLRAMNASDSPELVWLKQEFQLPDAEFDRIRQLHEQYLSGCAERCRQIDEKNAHLRELLAVSDKITPEIEQCLREAAALRLECQRQMLAQFYEISRTMPPAQGKRYLAWVQAQTVLADSHSQMQPGSDHHHE